MGELCARAARAYVHPATMEKTVSPLSKILLTAYSAKPDQAGPTFTPSDCAKDSTPTRKNTTDRLFSKAPLGPLYRIIKKLMKKGFSCLKWYYVTIDSSLRRFPDEKPIPIDTDYVLPATGLLCSIGYCGSASNNNHLTPMTFTAGRSQEREWAYPSDLSQTDQIGKSPDFTPGRR